ncbi:hypothetical protein [Marinoscillum sp.]|uniref:hypothetical protein n=1 Tax=Marinoscillum sp. TaxID=2024838 RepID=UPI003BAA806F
MSKNRSKAWTKHRSKLDLKEDHLKKELEDVSNDFEDQVKRIATISLISGVAVLGAYGLYKLLSQNNAKSTKTEAQSAPIQKTAPQEVKIKKSGFSFKNLLLERVAVIALKFIGAQLTTLLTRRFGLEESEEEQD